MKMETTMLQQRGMTITELLIAVAISLIVSAAIAGLFLQTKSSFMQNDEVAYMQDNGRFAMKVLADDLEMSEFWGGFAAANRGTIDTNNDNNFSVANVVDDVNEALTGCGDGTANWNYLITSPIQYLQKTNSADADDVFSCITSIDEDTDVLMIKRAKGESFSMASDLTAGEVYIRTNRTAAALHRMVSGGGGTGDPAAGYTDWPYIVRFYYVENSTLKRKSLGANEAYSTEILADGIEIFHIYWGIDNDIDGAVDYFDSSPTAAEIDQAVIAKIYIIVRSSKEVLGYTNKKTFMLGDLPVDPDDDGYYRRVFSTTVVLRNPETVQQFN